MKIKNEVLKIGICFINGLKIRNIYTFFIDKVNQYYFDYTKKPKRNYVSFFNKNLHEVFDDEKLSFKLNTKILNSIKTIINSTLTRITKTLLNHDSQLFSHKLINNEKWFIEEKENLNDFKIIGHKNFNRQYIFAIDVHKKSYLYDIIEQIQLSFYLDEKNNIVSGGFSFNWGNEHKNYKNFHNISDYIFMNDVTNFFISKYIENISLNKIVNLIDEKNEDKLNNNWLYNKWIFLIQKRYPKKISQWIKSGFIFRWFNSILITICVSLIIYEDLRKYFVHKKPIALNNRISKYKQKHFSIGDVNKNEEFDKDLKSIILLIKKNYLKFFKTDDVKNLEDVEDLMEEYWTIEENESFMKPITSFEITRNSEQGFINEKQNIFQNDNNFKTLFLMTLSPNLFGLNEDSDRYISIEEFHNKIKLLSNNNLLEETLEDQLEEFICEWNYDYATFINKNLSFLIVKNKNPVIESNHKLIEFDVNRKLYNNYFWSIIYSQSRLWKLWVIEKNFINLKNKSPSHMRRFLYELKNLSYDWNDEFYGMKEIRKIVKKVSDNNNLEISLNQLIKQINRSDHSYGKFKERLSTKYALLTAFAFGILDFFTTIFSILPLNEKSQTNISPIKIAFLSLGSILGVLLIVFSVIAIYKIYLSKKFYSWLEKKGKK